MYRHAYDDDKNVYQIPSTRVEATAFEVGVYIAGTASEPPRTGVARTRDKSRFGEEEAGSVSLELLNELRRLDLVLLDDFFSPSNFAGRDYFSDRL